MEAAEPEKQFKFPSFKKIKQIGNYQIWRSPAGNYSIIEEGGFRHSKTIEANLPTEFIAEQIVNDLQESVNTKGEDN